MNAPKLIANFALFAAASFGFGNLVSAQQLYRIVGADGKITFSDQPPAAANAKVTAGRGGRFEAEGSASAGNSALPAELRAVAAKFPVVLYTGRDCAPCGAGRALLQSRGIPFTEKTIDSREDAVALQRLFGDSALPALSIGGEQITGYSDQEWKANLDAAGYPKTSVLPTNYRAASATPMVAKTEAAPERAAAAAAPASAAAVQRPAAAGNANPTGIKF